MAQLTSTPTAAWSYDHHKCSQIDHEIPARRWAVCPVMRLPRAVPIYLLTNKFDVFGRSNQNEENSKTLLDRNLKGAMQLIRPGCIYGSSLHGILLGAKSRDLSNGQFHAVRLPGLRRVDPNL